MAKGNLTEPKVKKTITITSKQAEFIHENSISLSRFVQKKIDELIAEMS